MRSQPLRSLKQSGESNGENLLEQCLLENVWSDALVSQVFEGVAGRFASALRPRVNANHVFKPTAQEVARIIHAPSRGTGLKR